MFTKASGVLDVTKYTMIGYFQPLLSIYTSNRFNWYEVFSVYWHTPVESKYTSIIDDGIVQSSRSIAKLLSQKLFKQLFWSPGSRSWFPALLEQQTATCCHIIVTAVTAVTCVLLVDGRNGLFDEPSDPNKERATLNTAVACSIVVQLVCCVMFCSEWITHLARSQSRKKTDRPAM